MAEEGLSVVEVFGGRESAEFDELGEEVGVSVEAGEVDLGVDLREGFEREAEVEEGETLLLLGDEV